MVSEFRWRLIAVLPTIGLPPHAARARSPRRRRPLPIARELSRQPRGAEGKGARSRPRSHAQERAAVAAADLPAVPAARSEHGEEPASTPLPGASTAACCSSRWADASMLVQE